MKVLRNWQIKRPNPYLVHRKHFVLHWGFGETRRLIWFPTYGIWMLHVQKRSPPESGFKVQLLNILWNNPIWPFHATSSSLVRGSVTFYCLNKKPLWSFAPDPQLRTVKTQKGRHKILVISIWFCQNFPLKISKFSLIFCVLFVLLQQSWRGISVIVRTFAFHSLDSFNYFVFDCLINFRVLFWWRTEKVWKKR